MIWFQLNSRQPSPFFPISKMKPEVTWIYQKVRQMKKETSKIRGVSGQLNLGWNKYNPWRTMVLCCMSNFTKIISNIYELWSYKELYNYNNRINGTYISRKLIGVLPQKLQENLFRIQALVSEQLSQRGRLAYESIWKCFNSKYNSYASQVPKSLSNKTTIPEC